MSAQRSTFGVDIDIVWAEIIRGALGLYGEKMAEWLSQKLKNFCGVIRRKCEQRAIEEPMESVTIPITMADKKTGELGDCKERVAYDVAMLIAQWEKKGGPDGRKWF